MPQIQNPNKPLVKTYGAITASYLPQKSNPTKRQWYLEGNGKTEEAVAPPVSFAVKAPKAEATVVPSDVKPKPISLDDHIYTTPDGKHHRVLTMD